MPGVRAGMPAPAMVAVRPPTVAVADALLRAIGTAELEKQIEELLQRVARLETRRDG
jgi:hypothetical protein